MNFDEWMLRADTFKRVAQSPEDAEFWAGYMRGLRRSHHENFLTEDEHQTWLSIPADELDLARRAKGEGYRAGIEQVDPVELFNSLQNTLTAKQLAEKAGVVSSRIRQLAEQIPGGRKTDTGWKFPESAVEWVKAIPKPGPRGKKYRR